MQPGAGDNRLNTATMTLAHINKGWESLISGLQGVDSRRHQALTPGSPDAWNILYFIPQACDGLVVAGTQAQILEKWVSQDDKAQDTEVQVSCKETMFQ